MQERDDAALARLGGAGAIVLTVSAAGGVRAPNVDRALRQVEVVILHARDFAVPRARLRPEADERREFGVRGGGGAQDRAQFLGREGIDAIIVFGPREAHDAPRGIRRQHPVHADGPVQDQRERHVADP